MFASAPRVLALAALAGCGPLADATYRGEVLFTLEGRVFDQAGDLEIGGGELRVALFWAHDKQAREEQAVVLQTEFPARYILELYAYPPEHTRFEPPWDDAHDYAVGVPLLYLDTDLDGLWDEASERLVGGAEDVVVLFAEPHTDNEGQEPRLQEVHSGFQRMLAERGAQLCVDPAETLDNLFPAKNHPTDLVIGDWWRSLEDWNCDQGLDEWHDLCPGIDDLFAWCDRMEDPPPELEECLERCDDLGPDRPHG